MRIVRVTAHSAVMHRLCTMGSVAAFLALAIGPPRLAAQNSSQQPSVTAVVRDTSGAGISGAQVGIAGTDIQGYTDADGHLRLGPIAPGPARLTVRRLGFRATTSDVTIAASGATLDTVQLTEVAHRLDPITVRGSVKTFNGRLAGFYQRRSQGFGRFITREQIVKSDATRLSDLFRTIPGARLVSTSTIQNAVRMRGATSCPPLLWLDGTPAATAEYNLDTIDPLSVDAIEIYNGPSEVPLQFKPPMDVQACGAIVIWSHTGERHGTPRYAVNPDSLQKLVAALSVYTADQVDTPAHQDTSVHVRPVYPEALFVAGTSGKVVAEFVVDTTGSVSIATFSAISSTDPEFTMSVRRALEKALYVPAIRKGQKVQQVVEQPFTFVSDSAFAHGRGG
jgi:TonB family protein